MSQESIEALRAERDHLACALANASAQLEAISKEFELFSRSLSHDLRAPLRALEGFAQILSEDYGDKFDAEGKRCVETLITGAQKASVLVDDLHGFSRLCQTPCQPTVVDLRRLTEQKIKDLKLEGAAVIFRLDKLPEAWGDPGLLGDIMEELLRNAVKFTRTQPQPSVEISGRNLREINVYCVRDNGVGFDPKYATRLFGMFQRLHDEREFEGRGIGLAKVQRLVHRHGGTIWAESQVNAGAAFFFSLPVRPL